MTGPPFSDRPGAPWVPGLAPDFDHAWRRQLRERLFERRIVMISGALDDGAANQAAAELMTLDATGDDPVELQIDSPDGTLEAALSVMDVIELLGVPVRATCRGQVGGAAVGVLAVADHRAATPNARIRLFEPSGGFAGRAQDLERWAAQRQDQWWVFCTRVAAAVGRTPDSVAADMAAGRFLGAEEAQGYGLLDEVSRPDAPIHRLPGRPIGFRPR